GTVTFQDGATVIGTGILDGSGQVTFSTATLSVGTHFITAVYSSDANFAGSTSAAYSQIVKQASTTSVTSNTNPSVFGQSVTFAATVHAVNSGVGTPTGIVTFKDGTATLGTGTLNGKAQATFSIATLFVGSHSITATYGGSTIFATSTSTVLTQNVNQA